MHKATKTQLRQDDLNEIAADLERFEQSAADLTISYDEMVRRINRDAPATQVADGIFDWAMKLSKAVQAMHLGAPNRFFAVAKIELSECVPSAEEVDHAAVNTINAARAEVLKRRRR